MWREKVLTLIETLDEKYQRGLLEKDQPEAMVVMMDFIDGTPGKPIVLVAGKISQDEAKAQRWRYQHWTRARSELLNLFNQALPNVFLSELSEQMSKMNPCDIWKELEQKYGFGDVGGVIELRRQWERLISANWSNLGTLFAHLKKLRNDINRKMRGLVGKGMMTESGLCMKVLSLLPKTSSDCERCEEYYAKKRGQGLSSEPSARECYCCFEDGRWKKACLVLVADRGPKRPGGKLHRSNIRSAPATKKKRAMMAKVRVKVTTKKVEDDQDEERTPAEAAEFNLTTSKTRNCQSRQ
ncbi:hypothetical protein PC113_g5071 [Phytophthora cactorum]|uniref:Uncharacterized protein n=1 Tax=Phytophthora cactorum TaxID=29920 RepID=A0A8T0ZL85_9STRA|nr:hypothetical protein PC113_g5071 [Phytophthora cactorum]